MDYLNTVVNGFKIKNPYKKDWLPFVAILDNKKFKTTNVNQKQISRIYAILKKYISDRKQIFGSELEKDEKFEKSRILYENLVSEINNETIGFSTLFQLLLSIEAKENTQIKNVLLTILFLCENQTFKEAIITSTEEIDVLEYGGNDLKLFEIPYKIAKKRVNSEI